MSRARGLTKIYGSGEAAVRALRGVALDVFALVHHAWTVTETGTFTTTAGAVGNWRIEVRLENVTGTLNFRVQRP